MSDEAIPTQSYTHYAGFYSFQLPSMFNLSPGSILWLNGSDMSTIEPRQQYRPAFLQLIKRKEKELKETQPLDTKDSPYLKNVYHSQGDVEGVIFERMEEIDTHDVARMLEAYKWERNTTFKVMFKARDASASRYDSVRQTSKYVYMTNIGEKMSAMKKLLSNISFREISHPPENGKFAFTFGQVDPVLLGEHRFVVKYNNEKGVAFTIVTTNETGAVEDVLTQDPRVMEGKNGTTLAKKTEKINGINYSTWLVKTNEEKYSIPYEAYNFTLTTRDDGNTTRSAIELNMKYSTLDETAENGMSEEELITLWHQVIFTLRYQSELAERLHNE
ncbi:hypothetical protein GWD52_11270 [Enterobacteriaceae bacterium 4M9]|nr:hypothetical protein [Enterobacteriaceae bacterium 4M9]